jgi:lipoyl(octanoyl) transferase
VETLSVRLLPFAVAGGPENMAADEALLHAAQRGVASLRFYGWSEPTLSLGYFQPEALRRADPRLAALPYVRRPSGGATLVHHHEVTYALALPARAPWQPASTGHVWLKRMHGIVAAALGGLGVAARSHVPSLADEFPGFLCFRHFAAGDLLLGGAKVVGSAQRRHRGALLQHGAILLAQSPFTPELPGILELTGLRLTTEEVCAAVGTAFARATGWALVAGDVSEEERQVANGLRERKYAEDAWNRKR